MVELPFILISRIGETDMGQTEQLHPGKPVWGQNSKPVPSTYNQLWLLVF